MIKFLLQAILVVLCLLILLPMLMLLVGEGALAGKIFSFFLAKQQERTEIVEPYGGRGVTVVQDAGNGISAVQQDGSVISMNQRIESNGSSGDGGALKFLSLEVSPETVTGVNGEKGGNIIVTFKSWNMSSTYLYCMVRIYDADGEPVKCHTNGSKYRSQEGNVFTGGWCIPETDNQTSEVTLFLPYSELPQTKGQTEYLLDASFLRYTSSTEFDVLYRSEPLSFTYTVR